MFDDTIIIHLSLYTIKEDEGNSVRTAECIDGVRTVRMLGKVLGLQLTRTRLAHDVIICTSEVPAQWWNGTRLHGTRNVIVTRASEATPTITTVTNFLERRASQTLRCENPLSRHRLLITTSLLHHGRRACRQPLLWLSVASSTTPKDAEPRSNLC